MAKALGKELISQGESKELSSKFTEISNMLTPWINYLQRCNWKSRGIRPDDLPVEPPGAIDKDPPSGP